MKRVTATILFAIVFIQAAYADDGRVILKRNFDSRREISKDAFDTTFAACRVRGGRLTIFYPAGQKNYPSGLVCTLPITAAIPEERSYDFSFEGGGTEMSNSLFVSYAAGEGKRLSLPPLPGGSMPNDHSGYILRFIRHGDGTNELKIYRNDMGWTKELKNEWLASNPITTLRRLVIKHHSDGRHSITAAFDTGSAFRRTFEFVDNLYPPGNAARAFHISLKGHATVSTMLNLSTDSWIVSDRGRAAESSRGQPELDIRDIGDASKPDGFSLRGKIASHDGDYYTAYRYLNRAVEIRRELGTANTPAYAEDIFHLARIYSTKDTQEAERLFLESLRARETLAGPASLAAAESLMELGNFYQADRRFSAAERSYRRAVQALEGDPDSRERDRITAVGKLAGLYWFDLKRPAEADSLYSHIVRRLELCEDMTHPDYIPSLKILAERATQKKDLDSAYALYRKALETQEQNLGSSHPDVANSLQKLAQTCRQLRRDDEAETLFIRELGIREEALGPDHPQTAAAMNNLANLYFDQTRWDDAEELYKRSVAILEKALGPRHNAVIRIRENLSLLYKKKGEKRKTH